MAKTKTTKTAKKTAETKTSFLRKGALAYVGLYVAAYDRAKMRVEQVRKATDGLFDDLVEKGEKIEGQAVVMAKGAQVKVAEAANDTVTKVREVLPTGGKSRVTELEAEVEKLNKKIVAMGKKASATTKKAAMKTEKTVKAAAEKATDKVESATKAA